MDDDALRIAADVARLADAPDLVSWLGLPYEVAPADARAALDQRRRFLQTMQGNSKFRDLANAVLKGYRKLDELLQDVQGYLSALYEQQTSSRLPLLELAIDGVLADGVLTPEEAVFVRDQAVKLGIAEELFMRMLREKCSARGISLPEPDAPATTPVYSGLGMTTGSFRIPLRTLHMSHRAAGTGWWDEAFSRLLARQVPPDARRLVDLACGLGWTALSLLPLHGSIEYLGIDTNELHAEVAQRNLQSAGLTGRARVQIAEPTALPVEDGSVDVVTCIMNLQQFPDSRSVFAEATRVLRPGGRMIVVEPDCLSQQFWFDGPLPVFNESFRELCERANALIQGNSTIDDPLGQPGIAIGPHLGARLRAVGLQPEIEIVHMVQVAQQCSFGSFARRLRKRVEAMQVAAEMGEGDPVLLDVHDAIHRLENAHLDGLTGSGVHALPLFVVVGFKA